MTKEYLLERLDDIIDNIITVTVRLEKLDVSKIKAKVFFNGKKRDLSKVIEELASDLHCHFQNLLNINYDFDRYLTLKKKDKK